MKHGSFFKLAGCLLCLAAPQVPGTAAAQDARTIVKTVIERRAARLDGVDNYTLVETLNGAETTLYFERVDGAGFPSFRIVPPHEYQGEALKKAGLDGQFPVPGLGGDASLPGKLSLPEALPEALPKLPAGGIGGGQGSFAGKAAGAAVGAATGGLQEQLMRKGMQGLMKLAVPGAADGTEEAVLPSEALEDFARTARLEGTEEVDGARCHVLRADGIQDSELARRLAAGADVKLRSLAVWIDMKEYVPRRAVSEAEITAAGGTRTMTMELVSRDYRAVGGMYEPFQVVVRVSGLMDVMASADPKKAEKIRKEIRESLAKKERLEEMLASMPPEQRRTAEAQMGPALARLKQFSEGGSQPVEMLTVVTELRVNAGPPAPFGRGGIVVEGDASLELPEMIASLTPIAAASGRAAGWTIQLIGAIEGYAGGMVQVHMPGELVPSEERVGKASGSFRWEDGRQAQLTAPRGSARIAVRRGVGNRIAGEFAFEADAVIQAGEGTRRGRIVVRGRFEAPAPPAESGVPTASPPAIIR